MWLYPWPRCPDHPFSDELGDAEVNTRICKVLDHGANLNPGASPAPWGKGLLASRLVYLHPSWQFVQFHPLIMLVILCKASGMLTAWLGASNYLRMG
jgi:hypothetical protein